MKDFEAMMGWSQTNPWADNGSTDLGYDNPMTDDAIAALKTDAAGMSFLSSDAVSGDANSNWGLFVADQKTAGYSKDGKVDYVLMRCVKKKG